MLDRVIRDCFIEGFAEAQRGELLGLGRGLAYEAGWRYGNEAPDYDPLDNGVSASALQNAYKEFCINV